MPAEVLRVYYEAESWEPEDLFELAKEVAATARAPKAREMWRESVQTRHGFLGRKAKWEEVTCDVEVDYWVLATKISFMRRFGSSVDRSSARDEETHYETRFCLASDGSFRMLTRSREEVVWLNGSYDDMGWSKWKADTIADLGHFMIDFDFVGHARVERGEGRLEFTEVASRMLGYVDGGGYVAPLRQMYPKGLGLHEALTNLRSA